MRKTNISLAKKGMNRSTHPSQLDQQEYTFALNANLEDLGGETFALTNEHSNLLASKFDAGFVVIGLKSDVTLNRTFFFLHNPVTGLSEFGYIASTTTISEESDTEQQCDTCDYQVVLSQPLEEIAQTEHQQYVTLLADCEENTCFNFSILHPIKDIEVKVEKTGSIIVFTDNFNPPRYIQLDNLETYAFTGEIVCSEDDNIVPTCLACDKMKIFRDFEVPNLVPASIISGGRLKMGTYEFLIAYSDELGNEISEYYSLTNPIPIFDENNSTLAQENLADRTNLAIKLEVGDLDKDYTHYKIVVIETADINNATSYFIEGIHPINDTSVIYSTEENKQRTDISKIIRQNIFVRKWKGLTQSNSYLFGYGIEVEKELNLQPVMNLMGQFLKWQTHIAPEDLYENGVNVSLFTGYNRDEVVPFGIRFYGKNGYRTSVFNLPGRVATPQDLEEVPVDNLDRASIDANLTNCVEGGRTKRWQFYNDATEEGYCGQLEEIPTIEIIEDETKVCYIEDIATSTNDSFTVELDEPFTTIQDFIEDRIGQCIENPLVFGDSDLCSIFDITQYEDETCSAGLFGENCSVPLLSSQSLEITSITGTSTVILSGISGSANVVINGVAYPVTFNTDLTITGANFVTDHAATLASLGITVTSSLGVLSFVHNVDTPISITVVSTSTDLDGTVNIYEGFSGIEKTFPDDYSKIPAPSPCVIYAIENGGDGAVPQRDTEFEYLYGYVGEVLGTRVFGKIYIREYGFANESCSSAEDIINLTPDYDNPLAGYFHNYYGASSVDDLRTSKYPEAGVTDAHFTDKIHKGALWFKGDTQGRESFILEISKGKILSGSGDTIITSDVNPNHEVRMSIFNKCSDTTAIHSEIIALKFGGIQYKIDIVVGGFNLDDGVNPPVFYPVANLFPNNNFYVAVDNPIYQVEGVDSYIADGDQDDNPIVDKWRTAPADGCYSIATKNVEFSAATISWESIVLRKRSTYTSSCTYEQPILQKCTALPYKYGKMAYYESQETYPDNEELYNSQNLIISEADIPVSIKEEFEASFVNSITDGTYILKDDTNMVCKPIRHPRLPDNKVAPFMYEVKQAPFNADIIYPLGVTIDESIINSFLDIAVSNNLISQEQRDNIVKYEIVRGDISNDRSIQASGLLYDVRSYKEKNKSIYYPNYPYNDLGEDKLNLDTEESVIEQGGKFTFHSPETDYYKTTLPNELSIQGYMFGKSRGHFNEVKSHPKWVMLSDKGRKLAGTLAALEVTADIAMRAAQTLAATAQSYQIGGGLVWIGNPGGISVSIAAYASDVLANIANAITDYGRYRYEWLKIFRDLGQPHNFAYYYSSEGYYNYIKTLQEEGQKVRALNVAKKLKPNKSMVIDENTGERITVNNIDRESSVFISLGDFSLDYTDPSLSEYFQYDNNSEDSNTGSITFASENGECERGKSDEIIKNIASPYVALKNFIPTQYGTINSIKWLSTGYIGNLVTPKTECLSIFGGDTVISRHTLKRKIPLFLVDAMGQGNMIPYNYSFYSNIGRDPKFFVDYEMNIDHNRNNSLFPDISNDFRLDCFTKRGNYIIPSKFYLYYYGIPNFLCETRINTNFRYGKPELGKSFFPDVGDIGDWTQQVDVPLATPNYYFYNNAYSRRSPRVSYRTLPDSYSQAIYDETYDKPNGVMYSLPDNEENNLNEPWLIYRPFDFYEFRTSYGKLVDMRGIESSQVLARFDNTAAIFNSVDVTVETGQAIANNDMGDGGIFRRRPVTFAETDLGYMGSQTSSMVSNEFGHFYVDAKRGHVFKINPGGKGMEEISSFIGGKPSGMAQWFKEHLPFKILKQFPDVDVDNAYNGVGIAMGWDSRFKRVFITKKDYVVKPDYVNLVTYENGQFISNVDPENPVEVKLNNSEIFTDVSWTVAFSTLLNGWLSYYDFKPNYYVSHSDYFQTGINLPSLGFEFGLWSHLLTNKSYQVFYGVKHKFNIEYPDKELYATRTLNNVNMWTEARRYQNEFDYSYTPYLTFNQAMVFNNVGHSGVLNLVPQKNNIGSNKNFPKTNSDNTQDILVSNRDNFEWSFDYIYNRVKDNTNNQPKWLWDKNQIEKSVNSHAIGFTGKRVLDYLKGDYFLINLTYDKDSRFKILHKWSTQDYSI